MSSVCRICLSGNTSLQCLKNNLLRSFYEKLTNTKFKSKDARPRALCCYCYQKLLRCHSFCQIAVRSENIFNHLYENDLEVTHEYITEVKLNMKQHLSVAANLGSQVTIKEEPLPTDIDIKEEVTTEVDTLLEVESFPEECIKNQIILKEDISGQENDMEQLLSDTGIDQSKLDDSSFTIKDESLSRTHTVSENTEDQVMLGCSGQTGEKQTAKMLIFLQNGEERLITFILPRHNCTLREVIKQLCSIPVSEDSHIQCIQKRSGLIDYFVSVGSTTRIEEMLENHPMFVDEMGSRSSPSVMMRPQSRQGTVENSSPDAGNTPESDEQRSPLPSQSDCMFAVCKSCGYTGFDFSRCERCKRVFTEETLWVPIATKKLNKRRREPEREVKEKRRIRRRNNTDRKIGAHTEDQMQKALDAIKAGKSIRQAATENGIAFSTLQRYNRKDNPDHLTPNYSVRKIFTVDHEETLRDYYINCALMFYGLTIKDCRQIAYEMAKMNNVPIPESWEANKMAGKDWLRGFRERFPDMTICKPENCLSRATAFNRETVNIFFDNLQNVLSRSPAFVDSTRIYNLDETATNILLKNPRVGDPKRKMNICKESSSEKGTLVTTCNIISAVGFALPPVLVFPRKNINPRMEVGTPPGSLILASPTGWMSTENFVEVMKHFVQRSGSTKDSPTVLIMDNHESHLSIQAFNLAKESGVTVLTLPPHTSAKLQPLDVGIHGPFKSYCSSAMESWMMRNPGCPVTIYNIGALICQAFEKCMTPDNIKQSFRKTGIYPFNRNIFSDDDFMPSRSDAE